MKWNHAIAALAATGATACVSQVKYDQAVADATSAQQSLQYSIEQSIAHEEQNQRRVADLRNELEASRRKTEAVEGELSKTKLDSHNTNASLDEQIAANQELHAQLARLGQNVDQLVTDKNTLAKSLEDARQRLEESRRTGTAADAEALLVRDLASKLKPLTDAGELTLGTRDGRVLLQLPSDLLFGSRRAELLPTGAAALRKVAAALRALPGRQFQVGGQADRAAAPASRLSANLKLAAAEAAAVVELLVKEGVPAETLSAAAHSQYGSAVADESKGAKATGRGIEIMVLPLDGGPATPRSKS